MSIATGDRIIKKMIPRTIGLIILLSNMPNRNQSLLRGFNIWGLYRLTLINTNDKERKIYARD